MVPLLKPNIGKKGTLLIKGSLRNLAVLRHIIEPPVRLESLNPTLTFKDLYKEIILGIPKKVGSLGSR